MTTFNDLVRLVVEAGIKGGIPEAYLRVAPASAEDGTPHVEVQGDAFAYVVSERGCEFSRQQVTNLDALLYLIMSDIAANYAYAKECSQRTQGQDSRRAAFGIRLAIMNAINREWGARLALELDEILAHAPYIDR